MTAARVAHARVDHIMHIMVSIMIVAFEGMEAEEECGSSYWLFSLCANTLAIDMWHHESSAIQLVQRYNQSVQTTNGDSIFSFPVGFSVSLLCFFKKRRSTKIEVRNKNEERNIGKSD